MLDYVWTGRNNTQFSKTQMLNSIETLRAGFVLIGRFGLKFNTCRFQVKSLPSKMKIKSHYNGKSRTKMLLIYTIDLI